MNSETRAFFEGPSGSLNLCVESYQFPEIGDDEWDSNWLIIVGDAEIDGKHWRFRDACLTTFEVQRLADWLDAVAAGQPEKTCCGFTEPNIEFEVGPNGMMRIALSLEAAPPGTDPSADLGAIGFEVPIDHRLSATADALRLILTNYPVRAKD